MEFNKERESRDLINRGNENIAILSEHALRQLNKSLTGIIPRNVDSVEEDAFAYKFCRQAKEDY